MSKLMSISLESAGQSLKDASQYLMNFDKQIR